VFACGCKRAHKCTKTIIIINIIYYIELFELVFGIKKQRNAFGVWLNFLRVLLNFHRNCGWLFFVFKRFAKINSRADERITTKPSVVYNTYILNTPTNIERILLYIIIANTVVFHPCRWQINKRVQSRPRGWIRKNSWAKRTT